MSIKARLIAVLGAVLLVYTSASVITQVNLKYEIPKLKNVEGGSATRLQNDIIPLLLTIKDIKLDVVQVQQWISDISATRGLDGLNDGFDEAKANADQFHMDLAKARGLAQNLDLDNVVAALSSVEQAFPAYYETGVRMGEAYVAEGPAGGNMMMADFDAVAANIGENMDALIKEVESIAPTEIRQMVENIQIIEHDLQGVSDLNTILSIVGFVIALVGAVYLYFLIHGSIEGLLHDLNNISNRDYQSDMSLSKDRSDEFGTVAMSLDSIRNDLTEAQKQEAAQKAAEERQTEERRAERLRMAEQFETSVGRMMDTLASAAGEMKTTAQSVSGTADRTSQQASTVASAAEEASTNVQTVASAAEELSSSISEISRQVAQSTQIANTAVVEVDNANEKIQGLAEAANKIGEVVALITDIADQTNLLALNATIEAARAGEAGKGFAVVASEVKNLANATAKATEEISAQISGIQGATQDAVAAIGSIGGIINHMNEIASTIAAAVEEQGAATQEIARNVEQAFQGTAEVSTNIVQVTEAASETGESVSQILQAATELGNQSTMLNEEVANFLGTIRG